MSSTTRYNSPASEDVYGLFTPPASPDALVAAKPAKRLQRILQRIARFCSPRLKPTSASLEPPLETNTSSIVVSSPAPSSVSAVSIIKVDATRPPVKRRRDDDDDEDADIVIHPPAPDAHLEALGISAELLESFYNDTMDWSLLEGDDDYILNGDFGAPLSHTTPGGKRRRRNDFCVVPAIVIPPPAHDVHLEALGISAELLESFYNDTTDWSLLEDDDSLNGNVCAPLSHTTPGGKRLVIPPPAPDAHLEALGISAELLESFYNDNTDWSLLEGDDDDSLNGKVRAPSSHITPGGKRRRCSDFGVINAIVIPPPAPDVHLEGEEFYNSPFDLVLLDDGDDLNGNVGASLSNATPSGTQNVDGVSSLVICAPLSSPKNRRRRKKYGVVPPLGLFKNLEGQRRSSRLVKPALGCYVTASGERRSARLIKKQ